MVSFIDNFNVIEKYMKFSQCKVKYFQIFNESIVINQKKK